MTRNPIPLTRIVKVFRCFSVRDYCTRVTIHRYQSMIFHSFNSHWVEGFGKDSHHNQTCSDPSNNLCTPGSLVRLLQGPWMHGSVSWPWEFWYALAGGWGELFTVSFSVFNSYFLPSEPRVWIPSPLWPCIQDTIHFTPAAITERTRCDERLRHGLASLLFVSTQSRYEIKWHSNVRTCVWTYKTWGISYFPSLINQRICAYQYSGLSQPFI